MIFEYPRTLLALRGRVHLARCFLQMGPEFYDQSDQLLRGMVDDTSNQQQLTPEAVVFRDAIFLLGKLHYFQGDFDSCVARLEEALKRYPNERECPEARFLIAQSYRKLARLYGEQISRTTDRTLKSQIVLNWRSTLRRGAELYLDAIGSLEELSRPSDLERTYLKLAYIYYADCLYDLEDYETAVEAYERVADRYERDQIALAAYVQIINSYQRQGRWEKTRAVLARMRWLIKQLPDDAFEGTDMLFTRKDWNAWVDWNSESGLLNPDEPAEQSLTQDIH